MKLYDKQKTFEIKQFTKDLLIYHKPFYTNGTFVFNEKYLKGIRNIPAGDCWRLHSKLFYNAEIPGLHRIVLELAPKNPDDEKLIPCSMEPTLKGIRNFSLIGQMFSYEIDGEEHIKLINVDYLKYIDIEKCLFRTTAASTSPILIYDINNSEFIGLIMPIL